MANKKNPHVSYYEDPSKYDRAWFGRIVVVDKRDRRFLLQRNPEADKVTKRMWAGFPVMNQGPTPYCVGYAGVGWLMAAPIRNRKIDPIALYKTTQLYDEIRGTDYEGTTVRGLFKALKAQLYVSEYRWAFDASTVLDHILTKGPVVVGTNWYQNMQEPTKDGYVMPGGRDRGGHAYLLIGADRNKVNPDGTTGAFRIVNSWGRHWGQNGRAWVSIDFMDKLLKRRGESVTATELPKDPMPEENIPEED